MSDKYNVFANTQSSWNNLSETADITQWESPWGVTTPEWEGFETVDTDALATEGKNLVAFGATSLDVISSDIATLAQGDPRAIIEATDAAASAAVGFLQKKLDRIKTAWETPTEVTVKALMNEVAPYVAGDLSSVTIKLGDVLKNVTNELLGTSGGTWDDIVSDLGEQAVSYITTDANFIDSVSNLAAVKTFADTMQTVAGVISAVRKILTILEPLSPILEIGYEIVASWCTGGASAVDAGNKSALQVEDIIAMLLSAAGKCIRKYVYNIKIQIPSLLVNIYQSSGLSIKDYVTVSWNGLQKKFPFLTDAEKTMMEGFFSDSYYEENFANPEWKKQINKMLDKVERASKFPGWATDSSSKWNRYMSDAVVGVVNAAVKKARQTSFIPDYNKVIWSDPTTWFENSKKAWTREQNWTSKFWGNIGSFSDYEEIEDIFDSEDNPIKSSIDIVLISKNLMGSDWYRQWQDELAKEEEE